MGLTCGFLGLGLIGGSIAKALKKNVEGVRVLAADINKTSLEAAVRDGTADAALPCAGPEFSQCDYLFLCAPVQENGGLLKELKQYLSPDCVLTDVGSVKSEIHRSIREAGLEEQFIGGHPMAGSERTGYLNSKAALLENAYYILTPTARSDSRRVGEYRALVEKMGAIPLILDCGLHDYATAAVSHLPHIIAASLVNLVRDSDTEAGLLKMIAAGGFKDITRIASSSAVMWKQICLTNTDNITKLLDQYISSLSKVRAILEQRDDGALHELFDGARIYRDSFIGASSGPIKISYTIDVDIADEPGALASIATLLAVHGISIKNIGIIHNREYEGGVLKIELYEETAMLEAGKLLAGKGYLISGHN